MKNELESLFVNLMERITTYTLNFKTLKDEPSLHIIKMMYCRQLRDNYQPDPFELEITNRHLYIVSPFFPPIFPPKTYSFSRENYKQIYDSYFEGNEYNHFSIYCKTINLQDKDLYISRTESIELKEAIQVINSFLKTELLKNL